MEGKVPPIFIYGGNKMGTDKKETALIEQLMVNLWNERGYGKENSYSAEWQFMGDTLLRLKKIEEELDELKQKLV